MEILNKWSLDSWNVFSNIEMNVEWRTCRIGTPVFAVFPVQPWGSADYHRYWRTHGRRPSRKHRHWNCVLILLVISCEKGPFPIARWTDSVSSCFMCNTMMNPWEGFPGELNVEIDYQKCFPVTQVHSALRNHCWLNGNVRQSSTMIWFHFLRLTWIIHWIHLFLQILQLWS